MKNAVLKLRILFILGCICVASGVFMWGADLPYWYIVLWFGIFFMGVWTFIMVVNPELKDYEKERRKKYKDIFRVDAHLFLSK